MYGLAPAVTSLSTEQIDGLLQLHADQNAKLAGRQSDAPPADTHDAGERLAIAKRLRRVARLAGIETALPQDNATAYGAAATCLGMIAEALERAQKQSPHEQATVTAAKLTAAEIEAGMQAFIASGCEITFGPSGLQAIFDAVARVRGLQPSDARRVLWGRLQERANGEYRAIKLGRLATSDASWGWRATPIYVEARTPAEFARQASR